MEVSLTVWAATIGLILVMLAGSHGALSNDVVKVPTLLSLGIIVAVITIAAGASNNKSKGQPAHLAEVEPKVPFEIASDEEIAQLDSVVKRKK